jgi:hypothetical protein
LVKILVDNNLLQLPGYTLEAHQQVALNLAFPLSGALLGNLLDVIVNHVEEVSLTNFFRRNGIVPLINDRGRHGSVTLVSRSL